MVPPGISMLLIYWSKKGSKMMTSSPGSMNPMKALSIPSLQSAPSQGCANVQYDVTFVRSGSDSDLRVGVQGAAEERRVGIGDGFLQTWATL